MTTNTNLDRVDFQQIVAPHRRPVEGTNYDLVDIAALVNELGAENLSNPAIRRTVELARACNADVVAALAGDPVIVPNERARYSAAWLARVLALLVGFVGSIVPALIV